MWKAAGMRLRLPGNGHLAFFSLGFLLVLALLNFSSLEFYNQGQGPTEEPENGRDEYFEEEDSEGGSSVILTARPSQIVTLAELRDAAAEALRSCSACAPHRL